MLEAYNRSKTHETVYPHECSPFVEVLNTYNDEDKRLISEEYLFVNDIADERRVPLDDALINEVESTLVKEMTAMYGRA